MTVDTQPHSTLTGVHEDHYINLEIHKGKMTTLTTWIDRSPMNHPSQRSLPIITPERLEMRLQTRGHLSYISIPQQVWSTAALRDRGRVDALNRRRRVRDFSHFYSAREAADRAADRAGDRWGGEDQRTPTASSKSPRTAGGTGSGSSGFDGASTVVSAYGVTTATSSRRGWDEEETSEILRFRSQRSRSGERTFRFYPESGFGTTTVAWRMKRENRSVGGRGASML